MTVRIALAGLGWAARSIWLPRLRAHPGFTLAAVVDPSGPARRQFAAGRGGAPGVPVLSDVDELDPADVDLVVVAVPNHLHCTVACGLLARGFTVFVEKPVCLSSAEADRLAAAESAGRGLLLGGSAARYRADVLAWHDLAGSLGRIRHVAVSWVRASGIPGDGWFTRRDLAGGGALVDLGWHLLDVVPPLLGTPPFDQVVGAVSADFLGDGGSRAAWRHDMADAPALPGDVEDTVRAFLLTGDGVSLSLRASWASHEPCDVTTIEVEGSTGTASLSCTFGFSPHRRPGSALFLHRHGRRTAVPVREEAIGAEYDRQLDHLPAALADPASRGRTAAEARWTIGAVERVYASAHAAAVQARPVLPAHR
ncbi:Gfo/Idh/MocA family oxidoreductase [Amycolatopsis minnesotensis]|uniref:Gfo/Idh/MocA family oxidoreductase n=1 Tax=Amycolatopsis minnesotensis TaxID=337894 RepID=A0ABP5CAL8_9PSEU